VQPAMYPKSHSCLLSSRMTLILQFTWYLGNCWLEVKMYEYQRISTILFTDFPIGSPRRSRRPCQV
jgi:hypothetical protein